MAPSSHDRAFALGKQTELVHYVQPSLSTSQEIVPNGLVGLMWPVTGTGATSKDDAFHCRPPTLISLGLKHHRHSAHSGRLQAVNEQSDTLATHAAIPVCAALPAAFVEDAHTERDAASTEALQR